MTLAELKALDARIPSLAEVLDIVPAGRRIFIEIKCGLVAVAPLENLLAVSSLPFSQIVLMEFDLDTVIVLNKIFPDAEVLWLNDFPLMRFPWSRRHAFKHIISTACQHGLDGINLQNIPQLDGRLVDSCRKHGLSCYCWTVDDAARAAKLIEYGIDGIATNRPGWMRAQLNHSNPQTR